MMQYVQIWQYLQQSCEELGGDFEVGGTFNKRLKNQAIFLTEVSFLISVERIKKDFKNSYR